MEQSLTFCLVLTQIDMASVFNIFLEHWLQEENKAQRQLVLRSRQKRIKILIAVRSFVSTFFDILDKIYRGQDTPEMRERFYKISYYLGKSHAFYHECSSCKRNVLRFELSHWHEVNKFLYLRCKNRGCGNTELTLPIPNRFFMAYYP